MSQKLLEMADIACPAARQSDIHSPRGDRESTATLRQLFPPRDTSFESGISRIRIR